MASPLSTAGSVPAHRKYDDLHWRATFMGCMGLYFLLRWMHNFTELTPTHDNVHIACVVIAVVTGIGASTADVWISTDSTPRAILEGSALLLLACMGGFAISSQAASLIEGWIDFPPSRTTSSTVMLPISRAYTTHGKGGDSWHIETTPSVEMDVTHSDYDFITAQGAEAYDHGDSNNEGTACAKLTVQRSGNAVRVMHPGLGTLRYGSIFICPRDLQPLS